LTTWICKPGRKDIHWYWHPFLHSSRKAEPACVTMMYDLGIELELYALGLDLASYISSCRITHIRGATYIR
jgi:hypothetical protein